MTETSLVFVGLHHLRLPVSDPLRSRDWYVGLFDFRPRLCLEEEDRVVGAVIDHDSGLTLGLHSKPTVAAALSGFCCLALDVGDSDNLAHWCRRLDDLGIHYGAPTEGHLGWYIEVPDPDGLLVRLHTSSQPSADEA